MSKICSCSEGQPAVVLSAGICAGFCPTNSLTHTSLQLCLQQTSWCSTLNVLAWPCPPLGTYVILVRLSTPARPPPLHPGHRPLPHAGLGRVKGPLVLILDVCVHTDPQANDPWGQGNTRQNSSVAPFPVSAGPSPLPDFFILALEQGLPALSK